MDALEKIKKAIEHISKAEKLVLEAIEQNNSLKRYYGSTMADISHELHKYGQGVDFQDKYLPSLQEIVDYEGVNWDNKIERVEKQSQRTRLKQSMENNNDSAPQSGYHRTAKAWYATDEDIEEPNVMFGKYHDDGSTSGEMEMRWKMLDGKLVPQLRAFDDSWKVLGEIGNELFKELAKVDNQLISEGDFVGVLNKLGYKDRTMYKREEKLHVARGEQEEQQKKGIKK